MKITIISEHIGIHGSFLNLLDFQDYLIRQGHKVTFYCPNIDHFTRNLLKTKRKYKLGEIKEIKTHIIKIGENIVTDFKSLVALKHRLVCKKLIIFDNAELTYYLDGITTTFYPKGVDVDIENILKKHVFDDHIFLMPPVCLAKFKKKHPNLNAVKFFKKINVKPLMTISIKNNGQVFYRQDIQDVSDMIYSKYTNAVRIDDMTKIFEYNGYVYYRRQDRGGIEQMGRLIFEFLIMGKQVYFFEYPNNIQDGLKDYWNYYGKGDKEIIRMMMVEDYEYKPWL